MKTSEYFANRVGRRKIAEAVGVLPTAVINAVVRGTFPSSWYAACQVLASEVEINCPPDLFGQKGVDNSQDVDCCADIQGEAPQPVPPKAQGQGV